MKPEPKPEPKPEARPDPKPESQEPRAEAGTEAGTEAAPEPDPQAAQKAAEIQATKQPRSRQSRPKHCGRSSRRPQQKQAEQKRRREGEGPGGAGSGGAGQGRQGQGRCRPGEGRGGSPPGRAARARSTARGGGARWLPRPSPGALDEYAALICPEGRAQLGASARCATGSGVRRDQVTQIPGGQVVGVRVRRLQWGRRGPPLDRGGGAEGIPAAAARRCRPCLTATCALPSNRNNSGRPGRPGRGRFNACMSIRQTVLAAALALFGYGRWRGRTADRDHAGRREGGAGRGRAVWLAGAGRGAPAGCRRRRRRGSGALRADSRHWSGRTCCSGRRRGTDVDFGDWRIQGSDVLVIGRVAPARGGPVRNPVPVIRRAPGRAAAGLPAAGNARRISVAAAIAWRTHLREADRGPGHILPPGLPM